MLAIASAIVLMAAAPGAADEDAGETYGLSPKHKTVPVQSRGVLRRPQVARCLCARQLTDTPAPPPHRRPRAAGLLQRQEGRPGDRDRL